jgi:integrase
MEIVAADRSRSGLPGTVEMTANGGLTASTAARIEASVPSATRRAYAGDWARFTIWCAEVGRAALPAAGETLAVYADVLVELGRAPSTVDRALAAISTAHRTAGQPLPNLADARAVLRSARRERAEAGHRSRKAAPATVDALRAMLRTCDPAGLAGVRDRALLLLGFAMGARRSELAALDVGDVVAVGEGLLVTVRVSKTDREPAGREVAVPRGGRLETCPVRAVLAWLETLAAAGRGAGHDPLFVRVDRHGVLGRVATGRGSVDGRLTGQAVALVVRRAAVGAGLDPDAAWSGHSLRRGFATEVYRAGADPLRIARHGGWADGSRVLLGYVDEVDRWSRNPLAAVGL